MISNANTEKSQVPDNNNLIILNNFNGKNLLGIKKYIEAKKTTY